MAYDPEYHRRYREIHRARIKARKQKEYLANQEKVKARSRQWSADNRERKLSIGLAYRLNNKEKRSKYMKERYKKDPARMVSATSEWRRKNPEKYKEAYLKKEYGITLAQFNQLLEMQDFRCAICKERSTYLAVDHNHESGEIRGLLCYQCNCGIGNFKDTISILGNAATYLTHPPARGMVVKESKAA